MCTAYDTSVPSNVERSTVGGVLYYIHLNTP